MSKIVIFGIIAAASILLAGCDTTAIPTQYKYSIVLAPESLYNCPIVTKWPAIKTLSDLQVARLVVTLAENNKICKSSLDAIHSYYATAKARIEGKNSGALAPLPKPALAHKS